MDPQLKQRVVGAAVLVAIFVVFVPIFLDETGGRHDMPVPISIDSVQPGDFNSRVVPLDDVMMEKVERAMDATPQELVKPQDWSSTNATATETPTVPVIAPRTGVTAWVIQVGSFSREDNAKALVEKLNKGGYTAFIEQLQDEGRLVFRVRVGPELTKVTADKLRDKLAKDIDLDGIVMRYP